MKQNNKKNKPVIENIPLSQEKLEELNSILELKISDRYRSRIIREWVGGTCLYCYGIPTKLIKWDVGDGDKLLERICDPCFQKHKSELGKRLQNMNLD